MKIEVLNLCPIIRAKSNRFIEIIKQGTLCNITTLKFHNQAYLL